MRLLSETKKTPNITKVVSRDQSRPVLSQGYLDVDRAVIEATDSYRLVSIPVEIEDGDVSGLIPPEALAAFHKARKRGSVLPSLKCGESEVTLNGGDSVQSWTRTTDGTFPNVPQLIPDKQAWSGFRIGLNARMLKDLAEGLGDTETVYLHFVQQHDKTEGEAVGYFPSNRRPILVTVPNGGDSIGLLMPVRIL